MTGSPYPPDYIKLPPSIACAGVDDALIVTMDRILGLCWDHKYRRSPPYTPDQLADLLGRPRTTLYRFVPLLVAYLVRKVSGDTVEPEEGLAALPPVAVSIRDAEGRPLVYQERK